MRVSIFTPTHDTKFLAEAYASIKDQDFYEWIIVYNNGAIPIDFGDSRIKPIYLRSCPEWVGPLKSLACECADGDILLELDHDDLLTAGAVEEVKAAFADPEIGFAYSNTIHAMGDFQKVQRFDEAFGWKYREVSVAGHLLDEHISFEPTPESVSRIWFAPNHLRAFRRDVYEKVGGYNGHMRILDDLDLMCRMYLETKFKHIDRGLYVYRVHGENTWLRYNAEIQENVYRIYDQYADRLAECWARRNNLRTIELGGRMASRSGYETVDLKGADIICDLNQKWSFDDSSVGVIRAIDVFEHLSDPIHVMKECYRILAPGGWLFCKVPSTDGRGAFSDPTHKSFWNELSFDYYTKASKAAYIDTPVRFQAPRIYTTALNNERICWTVANLINLKDGYRPCGMIEI